MKIFGRVIAVVFTMMCTSCATSTHSDEATDRGARDSKMRGKFQCFYTVSRNFVNFVKFVRDSDDESFSVSSPSQDIKALCTGHRKLTPTSYVVEGEFTRRILFWGGNLSVRSVKAESSSAAQGGT